MISRCPSCGSPAPDEARQCQACGWDFVANKKADLKPGAPAKAPPAPAKPAPAAPPPAGGLSLPPARGGSADAPAVGLGMARLPKVEPAAAPSAGAPEESPFALPVARNLGPKPGESLFAPPPSSVEAKLPDARPKEVPPPREEPPAREAKKDAEAPRKAEPPELKPEPKPVAKPIPKPASKPDPAPPPEEPEEEESPALFLPSSQKEIVVEPPAPSRPSPRPEPREPEPDSIFAKPSAEAPRRSAPAEPAPAARKPAETEGAPKPGGRRSAVYIAAMAGAALGLLSIVAIFVMLRADPQGAARSSGSSPFGKRSADDASLTPMLVDPAPEAPAPAPRSPAPVAAGDAPASTSLPAPALARSAAPPSPVAASAPAPAPAPPPAEAPKPAPIEAPKAAPARATATFARVERPQAAPKRLSPKPAPALRKTEGPQWVFEGTVYDLLSTRGVYGVKLLFVDAEDNEVFSVDTEEGGYYRAAMRPGPPEGYGLRVIHDDYSGKHIDELDSTSSVRKADLEQRKFLMQAGARSLPWIGALGKPVRRDMALVPKAQAE